ncbi:MAG: hypothetical protein ACK56I_04960, partial [bacterium]
TQGLLLLFAGLAHPLSGAIEIALLLLLLLQVVVSADPGEGPAVAVDRHHQIGRWTGAGLAHEATLRRVLDQPVALGQVVEGEDRVGRPGNGVVAREGLGAGGVVGLIAV